MTVKQISDIIFQKQRVCVWSVSAKRLFEGVNGQMPETLNNLNVRFISSDLKNDLDNDSYNVVTTIYVD